MFALVGQRAGLPDDCQKANSALNASDYDLAIEHYFLCIDTGELSPESLADVFMVPYAAKGGWTRGRQSN